jgi:hypothetical protein
VVVQGRFGALPRKLFPDDRFLRELAERKSDKPKVAKRRLIPLRHEHVTFSMHLDMLRLQGLALLVIGRKFNHDVQKKVNLLSRGARSLKRSTLQTVP